MKTISCSWSSTRGQRSSYWHPSKWRNSSSKVSDRSSCSFIALVRWFSDAFDEDDQFLAFQSLIKELLVHSIDSTEYTLLKLILIFHHRSWTQSFIDVSTTVLSLLALSNDLHSPAVVDKYRKDALFMLTEYTRNAKYRRLAELLMLLSNLRERTRSIHLDQLFFRQLIHRVSMKTLLHSIARHLAKHTQ